MKPNIFVYKNLKNEDHFTNSLGYLLNLFPRELGDRFVSKLATSTGKSADYLGKFIEAEFTGHNFLNEDSTSKPDLVIHTEKLKLFFEIKLAAPLSDSQLERHLNDVRSEKGKLILISNVRTKVSKKVLAQSDYLKPLYHDHFFWTEFEPVFNFKFRKNSLEYLLLSDFQKSLRSNEIKARQIVGAEDNLYTGGSKAQALALNILGDILKDIGFKVWRLPQEHTLRVYPKKMKEYPLINPRFYSTGEWLSPELIEECLVIICYVDINNDAQIELLSRLNVLDSKDHITIFTGNWEGYYKYYLYVPLQFKAVGDSFDLNWENLKEIWKKIYKILAK